MRARRSKAQTLYKRLSVWQRRIKCLGQIFKFNLKFFRQIWFNLYVAESLDLFDCMVNIELNLKIWRYFKLGLTCLAAISCKSCSTAARVIVFTIYTRPTVQTFVINAVVDVCQKHRSTLYNVGDHLNLLVNFFKYKSSRLVFNIEAEFFFKATYLSRRDSQCTPSGSYTWMCWCHPHKNHRFDKCDWHIH